MKSITFAVPIGGVGKSILTANVGTALALKNYKVILVEGQPVSPLGHIFNLNLKGKDAKLDDVIEKDLPIEKAIYQTEVKNLFLIPSGISLESYFDLDPLRFVEKLAKLDCDYLFVDVPYPMAEAAFLSFGFCQYSIIILTEYEFTLSVESAIDTIRVGKHFLKCLPIGFVINKIEHMEKFNEEFIKDIEDLLEIPCIARIKYDPKVLESYEASKESKKAFIAYQKYPDSEFSYEVNKIAEKLMGTLPKPKKEDVKAFLTQRIHEVKL